MFKRISAEAENLMNSIKQLILEDFDSSDSSIALIGSSAGLLLSLSHLPANDLGRLYLHRYRCLIFSNDYTVKGQAKNRQAYLWHS